MWTDKKQKHLHGHDKEVHQTTTEYKALWVQWTALAFWASVLQTLGYAPSSWYFKGTVEQGLCASTKTHRKWREGRRRRLCLLMVSVKTPGVAVLSIWGRTGQLMHQEGMWRLQREPTAGYAGAHINHFGSWAWRTTSKVKDSLGYIVNSRIASEALWHPVSLNKTAKGNLVPYQIGLLDLSRNFIISWDEGRLESLSSDGADVLFCFWYC